MRPPNKPLSRIAARNVESVEAEIIQEKAASLGRMSNRLRDAMARLEAHDASPSSQPEERAALVAAAGEALWYYVVQREAAGLSATEEVLRDFRIPREVYIRMGPAAKRG